MIETLASLTIFAIITVGVVPLLASSLRGATLGRSYTEGKNVGVRVLERIRGMPYHRSVSTTGTTRRVDVLDLLFPCAPSAGAVGGVVSNPCSTGSAHYAFGASHDGYPIGTFVTHCPVTSGTNVACPAVPAGYSVTIASQFVAASGGDPETYSVLNSTTTPAVPTTYAWNATSTENPPSRLLKVQVVVSWVVGAEAKSYTLDTLVADRKFGVERINGSARVDYSVRAVTTYNTGTALSPVYSDLNVIGASAESSISSRLSALASQTVRGGEISLVRAATETAAAVALIDPPATGVSSSYGAPPEQTSIPDPAATAGATVSTHPGRCQNPAEATCTQQKQVGYLAASHAKGMSVSTGQEVPTARGEVLFNPSSPTTYDLYIDSQRNSNQTSNNPLKLQADTSYGGGGLIDSSVMVIRTDTGVASNVNCTPTAATPDCRSMYANTSATTTATTDADRKVETIARTGFAEMRLFPTTFIPGTGANKAVVVITDFVARVSCKSTGTVSTPSATWSAKFSYWRESSSNNGNTSGSYTTPQTVTQATFGDFITTLKASNPMVYEEPEVCVLGVCLNNTADIYMFPNPGFQSNPYYLQDLTTGQISVSPSGSTSATAKIVGAMSFTTGPTDPQVTQSALSIVLGSLSCSATDSRG